MNRYAFFAVCLVMWLLSGCKSVEQLSIDYMIPADISFPPALKRVAIVNNMPESPDNRPIMEEKNPKKPHEYVEEISRKYYNGNPRIMAESLAESIAEGNYFNEVIICDSALRVNDITPRTATLSQSEVETLTRNLRVDFLIAVENLQLKATRKLTNSPMGWISSVDVTAYPTIAIYVPKRRTPLTTLSFTDSIYWENYAYNLGQVQAKTISEKDMLRESSEFAGTIPAKHLLPHWNTTSRYYFAGGTSDMRDAAVYAREGQWQEASRLWRATFEQKKGKLKMYAAYNLALSYEMQDSISTACHWAEQARDIAYELDKVEQKTSANGVHADDVPNYFMTSLYLTELKKRAEGFNQLDLQMRRFDEEQ